MTDLQANVQDLVQALVERFAAEHRCPSTSWAVVRHGRAVMSGATGTLDDGTTPTPQTVYRIASMTKSFTAAAVLALRDDGVLRLDDPIGVHAPELAALTGPTADAAPLTVGALLSMASGLATDDVWADRHLDLSDDELDAIMASGCHFAVDPGTRFEYSNLGYALVGRVVLRATGRTVQQHVTERFLEPLGLRRTGWVRPDHDDWARPYRVDEPGSGGGRGHVAEVLAGDGVMAPMGGLWSCVDDLVTWSAWLDAAFPARDDPEDGPLRRSSRRDMHQLRTYAGPRTIGDRAAPQAYGYGLLMRDDPVLGLLAGHSGGLPGYGSNMRWAPGRGVGAIALGNVTYAPMAVLTLQIMDALHAAGELADTTVPVHAELARLAAALVELIDEWDDARADAIFTDNVALDEPYERRLAAARAAVDGAGPLTIAGITALSAAAADVAVVDAAGRPLHLELELAPLRPVRIESWSIERRPDGAADGG